MANLFNEEQALIDDLDAAFAAPNVGDYDKVNDYSEDDLDQYAYDAGYDNDQAPADVQDDGQEDQPQAPPALTPEQERIAQLEQRLSQRDMDEIRATNQVLAQRVQELTSQLEQRNTTEQPKFDINSLAGDYALTDEERETYGASQAVIDKLARAAALDILRQYDQQRVASIEQGVSRVAQVEQQAQQYQAEQARAREQALVAQIQAANSWLPQVVNTQPYRQYLSERIPGTPYTREQMIEQGVRQGDANLVNEIIRAYPGNPNNNNTQRPLGVASAPGRANTAQPANGQGGQARQFDYNRYIQAHQQVANGTMTLEDFEKVEAAYYRAVAEGRVKI